ncbi:DUF3953 domain-containing protein [Lysinibacillus sphaericus]|uniref:Group-specific protein n=1 Tax=Lysinibacillus sphaericus TaxID=1421 RepID=A0A2S0K0H5_LYSSH|nr:hypothetical protein LS41612_11660 [Lysinibacillus sphaericus]TKI20568.1 DUF3953 domain-containing protein [Lysinibacillus sphaericus]GEC81736.1 hypothetical protein LSP03_14790 [Lysinibacillus sphaericus]SUV17294.1 group-specific protein [Lysinibacillus sphaericus]
MLKILRILFSIVGICLALYGFITKDYKFQAYMILFLGLMMLIMGIQEFQHQKKFTGWLLIFICLFSFFVAIQSFTLL